MGGKEDVLALSSDVPPFPKSLPDPSPTDLPARKKHNSVPPRSLNTNPLVQIIGMEMIADVIIDDAKACALLDSGATTDLMSLAYAKAQSFDIKLIKDLSDHFMNLKLAEGFRTTASGYVEYNLHVPGVSSYDSDRVALVTEDKTLFGQEVRLLIGTKTEDTILEAMKEGEIELLDSIWKWVKNNRSLLKLWDEVGLWEAVVQVAKATGEEPPEFKDHSPYLNWGMEDLLELNKLISMARN